ncbi:adrenocorticotropic hormone receptor-like isoform X2 [Dendronephthya gigantea]|nr:adrenocorticotropic hormone receptor-like isoform X2 [Dendronephthya gigantea]
MSILMYSEANNYIIFNLFFLGMSILMYSEANNYIIFIGKIIFLSFGCCDTSAVTTFNNHINIQHTPTQITTGGALVPWSLAVYTFLIVVAIIANIMLLFAMHGDPLKCFQNPNTKFIGNVSIADLLNSLFHFKDILLSQTTYQAKFCMPGILERIYKGIAAFLYFLPFPAVAVLALERYVSIAFPLWHKVYVTSCLCYIWIAIVWTINFIFSWITTELLKNEIGLAGVTTVYTSVFFLATVLIYLLAFISIRKQHSSLVNNRSRSETTIRMTKLRLRNQNRFLTTVLLVNIVLILGIMPTIIGVHWHLAGTEEKLYASDLFPYIADILYLINTAASPFLYLWRLPKYRKTFYVMYCCKK